MTSASYKSSSSKQVRAAMPMPPKTTKTSCPKSAPKDSAPSDYSDLECTKVFYSIRRVQISNAEQGLWTSEMTIVFMFQRALLLLRFNSILKFRGT